MNASSARQDQSTGGGHAVSLRRPLPAEHRVLLPVDLLPADELVLAFCSLVDEPEVLDDTPRGHRR